MIRNRRRIALLAAPVIAAVGLLLLAAAAGATPVITSSGPIDVAIADGAPESPVELPLEVVARGNAARVRVSVAIRHGATSDLEVRLAAPNGDVVTLLNHRVVDSDGIGVDASRSSCGSAMTTFHPDASPATWEWDLDSYDGYDVPSYDSLNRLRSSPAAGTWELLVSDDDEVATGSVLCWKLTIDPPEFRPRARARVIYLGRNSAVRIGPLRMNSRRENGSLSSTINAFGAPTASRRGQWLTYHTWKRWGIRGDFYTLSAGKAETYVDAFVIRGAGWRTNHGLRIGDSIQRLRRLYPTAQRHRNDWWLRRAYIRYGDATWIGTVTAQTRRGKVTAFKLYYHAGGE